MERFQMTVDANQNDTFNDFGNEVKIGNRPIARKFFLWLSVLLKLGYDNGMLKLSWENAFCKRAVDYVSYRGKQ